MANPTHIEQNTSYALCTQVPFLAKVLWQDARALDKARESYGESWCKRGGIGAFMMLSRKWDRLENHLSKPEHGYDILKAIQRDTRAEGLIDDVRDLRRYLALVEAKLMERGECPKQLGKDDEQFSTGPGARTVSRGERHDGAGSTVAITGGPVSAVTPDGIEIPRDQTEAVKVIRQHRDTINELKLRLAQAFKEHYTRASPAGMNDPQPRASELHPG